MHSFVPGDFFLRRTIFFATKTFPEEIFKIPFGKKKILLQYAPWKKTSKF